MINTGSTFALASAPPDLPRPEYPRPHFDRSHSWLGCNGQWDFAAGHALARTDTVQPATVPLAFDQQITVPFSWDTAASGIGAPWLSEGWYRRAFTIPAHWLGQRTVLHFGAVHHQATIWVNDLGLPPNREGMRYEE